MVVVPPSEAKMFGEAESTGETRDSDSTEEEGEEKSNSDFVVVVVVVTVEAVAAIVVAVEDVRAGMGTAEAKLC